jgi:hypothetical protein
MSPMDFLLENRVGRLIEARLESKMSLEDTQLFRTRMWTVLGAVAGKAVIIADLQRCELFSSEVAEKLLAMLKHDTPKVERTAFVIRGSATFAMQVDRMIAEAAQAAAAAGRPVLRRSFRDKAVAKAWLDEVLSTAERARLAEFIAAM